MKTLFPWAFGSLAAAAVARQGVSVGAEEKCLDREFTHGALSSNEESMRGSDVDPKVAEFFKDFPEPYRQKAIHRFSSRDGLYRWDIFRTSDMQREKRFALIGTFLEDRREAEELARKGEKLERTNNREEMKRLFYERVIPGWEQATLKVIPLQAGDSMLFKLFQTSSLLVIATLGLTAGVVDKRNQSLTKLRANVGLIVGVSIFVCCNVIASARLLDLDLFDRTMDDRFWYEKFEDEVKQVVRPISSYLNERTWRP